MKNEPTLRARGLSPVAGPLNKNPFAKPTQPQPKPARWILNVRRLPARLDAQETADLLGFKAEHIPILIRAGLLAPLGNPVANAPKYFSSAHLLEQCVDNPGWLHAATEALSLYWSHKNESSRASEDNQRAAQ